MQISVKINDANLTARVAKLNKVVSSNDFLRVGGVAVTDLIRRHVASLSVTRHKSANRLGATPSQHYDSNKVFEPEISGGKAVIGIGIRGYSRAYKDLLITPIKAKMLTIPIHAMAYGTRVRELRARGTVIFRPKGTDILAMAKPKGETGFIPLYALKSFIRVPQDPSLMPTDMELKHTFKRTVESTLAAMEP